MSFGVWAVNRACRRVPVAVPGLWGWPSGFGGFAGVSENHVLAGRQTTKNEVQDKDRARPHSPAALTRLGKTTRPR
jgi:hypothetical protein